MIAYEGIFHNFLGNPSKEPDVLKIVKEDVLRILCERGKKSSLEIVKDEIKVAYPLISEALEELERDDLIEIRENSISLTELGQKKANNSLHIKTKR